MFMTIAVKCASVAFPAEKYSNGSS